MRVDLGQDGPGQREAAQQVHARELHDQSAQRPVPPPVERDQRQRAHAEHEPQAVDEPRAPALLPSGRRRRRLGLLLWHLPSRGSTGGGEHSEYGSGRRVERGGVGRLIGREVERRPPVEQRIRQSDVQRSATQRVRLVPRGAVLQVRLIWIGIGTATVNY